jgi:hypothetical protein
MEVAVKVSILNLGAIQQAEIDLKPLTVFVGPNNSGKTWAAYMLCATLGQYGWRRFVDAYVDNEARVSFEELDTALQQLAGEGNAKIDLVKFADEHGEQYFNAVAQSAREWMSDFMRSDLAVFDSLSVRLDLLGSKPFLLDQVRNAKIDDSAAKGSEEKPLLRAVKEKSEAALYFYTEGAVAAKLPARALRNFVISVVFRTIHQSLYRNAYPFPTERTTYITMSFIREEIPGDEILVSTGQAKENRRPKIVIEPIGQFLSMVARAYDRKSSDREQQAKNNPQVAKYIEMAYLLERGLLEGGVNFSTPEPAPRRDLLFQAEGFSLEIPIASSMVKELSPLVLYLRYLARPGELLVIDEPEMNLHPEAQLRMTELLAMLVNAGLPVLITTHSPYVVDHLTNLMKAAEHSDPASIQDKFLLQRKEAFIPKRDVAVYLFEGGTAKDILEADGLINWRTFSKVSDRVSQLYFEI